MRACLTHPHHGYYTSSRPIFGAGGDFITSPQISPIFSELLAVWIANFVHTALPTTSPFLSSLSSPSITDGVPEFDLVELGPGDAALQRVLLPALTRLRARPANVALVEASQTLADRQRKTLAEIPGLPTLSWHGSLEDALLKLDEREQQGKACRPTMFIAHEFFDALPVHIFQRTPRGWVERLVDADVSQGREAARLRFVLSRSVTPATALVDVIKPGKEEQVVEVCASGLSHVRRIADRVKSHGGAGLIIDYGAMERRGVSVRAIEGHGATDVLAAPGSADVTADVDFGALREAVRGQGKGQVEGCEMRGAVSQREWLLRLGAAERFRVVARGVVQRGQRDGIADEVVDESLTRLQQDYDRLTGRGDKGMGSTYKVAAVVRKSDVAAVAGMG